MRDSRLMLDGYDNQKMSRTLLFESLREAERGGEYSETLLVLKDWWMCLLDEELCDPMELKLQFEKLRMSSEPQPEEVRDSLAMIDDVLNARALCSENRDTSQFLLGVSAAHALREVDSVSALDRVVKFLSGHWPAIEELCESLTYAAAWPERISDLCPTMTSDSLTCPIWSKVNPDMAFRYDQEERKKGVFFYSKSGEVGDLMLSDAASVRFKLIARRSVNELARAADELPHYQLRAWLWRLLFLDEDPDLILEMLLESPDVFEANSWTGGVSAIAALEASVQYADRVFNTFEVEGRMSRTSENLQQRQNDFIHHECSEWISKVICAVRQRRDGDKLLLMFSVLLVERRIRPFTTLKAGWSAEVETLGVIERVLLDRVVVEEVRNLGVVGSSQSESRDEFARLLTSAMLCGDVIGVWMWLRELLLKHDERTCLHVKAKSGGIVYDAFAKVLLRLPNPYKEWHSLWNDLFVIDRERSRFARNEYNVLAPSLFVVRVGIAALRQKTSFPETHKFYDKLLVCSNQLLTYCNEYDRPEREEIICREWCSLSWALRVRRLRLAYRSIGSA